jgi:hypothetical protein
MKQATFGSLLSFLCRRPPLSHDIALSMPKPWPIDRRCLRRRAPAARAGADTPDGGKPPVYAAASPSQGRDGAERRSSPDERPIFGIPPGFHSSPGRFPPATGHGWPMSASPTGSLARPRAATGARGPPVRPAYPLRLYIIEHKPTYQTLRPQPAKRAWGSSSLASPERASVSSDRSRLVTLGDVTPTSAG